VSLPVNFRQLEAQYVTKMNLHENVVQGGKQPRRRGYGGDLDAIGDAVEVMDCRD